MAVTKQLKIKNKSGSGYDSRDIGAEAQYIDVSRDNEGEIITDLSTQTVDSVESLAETLKDIEDNKQDNLTFDEVPVEDSINPVKSGGIYAALDTKIDTTSIGVADGVAGLDENGKIPHDQLPSDVSDVKEGYFNSEDGKFYEEETYETEIPAEIGKIYIDKASNITYRWSGSEYIPIGSDLTLGETETTAYRGDRGKIAYDDSQTNKADIADIKEIIGDMSLADAWWDFKNWNGLEDIHQPLEGLDIWTDGENIYYSFYSDQYVFDKSTSTWINKEWNGFSDFEGAFIWTDGENIYYSDTPIGSSDFRNYVLNKETSTWEVKTWSGYQGILGSCIWSDGDNVYFSLSSDQYVLNKETSSWEPKVWSGFTDINILGIWTDGENTYYSSPNEQYVLNKETSTWEPKTWNGFNHIVGCGVWTDNENIYYSNLKFQYVLNKATSTWDEKDWGHLPLVETIVGTPTVMALDGREIWTDGENIYHSTGDYQYVLIKSKGFGTAASRNHGTSNGVADLDIFGKIPKEQLPTFVGTTEQWNALSELEQQAYQTRVLTDDSSESRGVDEIPTEDSLNLITSGGVYSKLSGKADASSLGTAANKNFTTSVTSGNNDVVTSGAVYTALSGKADASSLGTAANKNVTTSVILGSNDVVTSGAVYNYIDIMITAVLEAGY